MRIANNHSNNHNKTSFGLHYKMHSDIVQQVIPEFRIQEHLREILVNSVAQPDFDEFILYGQNHFFYPNSKVKSFLDFSGKSNAKAMYHKHIKAMLHNLSEGDKAKGVEEGARGLHYLHDVTQPHHIQQGSVFAKLRDVRMPHHKFEMDIYDIEGQLFENTKEIELCSKGFSDLFDETVGLSLQNPIPTKNNQKQWVEYGQNTIDLALSSTKRFFEILTERFNIQ